MAKPTQLVISEQAREAAEQTLHIVTICGARNSYVIHDRIAEQIQLLLNAQREAIIRECAATVVGHYPKRIQRAELEAAFDAGIVAMQEAILAKLQNK